MAATVSWDPLIDDILDNYDPTTLDASFKGNNDQSVADQALDWINNEDYDLIFVDFDGVDGAGKGQA